MTVVGIDVGGSGSRASTDDAPQEIVSGPGAVVTNGHADYTRALAELASTLSSPVQIDALAIGATGMLARADPATVAVALRQHWRAERIVVASDAVTGLAGAWGTNGGAVVSAGTGVVALGTDFSEAWHRADGWGPWIGDLGGGAWIGARGLTAAMNSFDQRPGGSRRMLDAARAMYGSPADLPALLRGSANTAARLAEFVPAVAAAARDGEPVASRILEEAASHLADAATAVLGPVVPPRVALIGGVVRIGDPLTTAWIEAVRARHPDVEIATNIGSSLAGALLLAEHAASGSLPKPRPPFLTVFPV